MLYGEQDIDFLSLSDRRFEELCFDLLIRLGYKDLMWRQGGSDHGRDIEGRFVITSPLVGSYDETWFFECKRYHSGVPLDEITSKIAWADAERPQHFVIIISSYLSNSSRVGLDKFIAQRKPYAIHMIEGKQLKTLLLAYDDLVAEYFGDKYCKLLRDAQKNFLIHNLMPDPATLHILSCQIDPDRLCGSEIAFLLAAIAATDQDIERWCENNEYFNMDHFFAILRTHHNAESAIIDQLSDCMVGDWACGNVISCVGHSQSILTWKDLFFITLTLNYHKEQRRALYLCATISEVEAIELLIEVTGDFPTKIRYFKDDSARESCRAIKRILSIYEESKNIIRANKEK
jgi:hypothetical protein